MPVHKKSGNVLKASRSSNIDQPYFLHLSTNERLPASLILFLRFFAGSNFWLAAKYLNDQNPK